MLKKSLTISILLSLSLSLYHCGKTKTRKLGEIAEFQYGYTATSTNKGEFRYIRITDIDEFGEITEKEKKYIDLSSKEDQVKYLLKKGDIVVSRTGSTGKTALFWGSEKCIFASYLIRIKFNQEEITPKYYWYFAKSQEYWEKVNLAIKDQGTSQPQFNANALKNIKVPLPSIEKQEEIVNRWERKKQIIIGLKEAVSILQEEKKEFLNSLWKD